MNRPRIHPTALIDPGATVADDVKIGPYAIIEAGAVISEGCTVEAHAQILNKVELGSDCLVGHAAIIGGDPQDLSFDNTTDSGVRIGSKSVMREHVTIHRSTSDQGWTTIGSENFLMAHSHVGHDCNIGDGNIFANNVMIAGHIQIGARNFFGGGAGLHQFVHVGDLCMIRGNSSLSQDVPPYCLAYGDNHLAGLNSIGLRRAGISAEERIEIKKVLKSALFGTATLGNALAELQLNSWGNHAKRLLNALQNPSRKGIISPK